MKKSAQRARKGKTEMSMEYATRSDAELTLQSDDDFARMHRIDFPKASVTSAQFEQRIDYSIDWYRAQGDDRPLYLLMREARLALSAYYHIID